MVNPYFCYCVSFTTALLLYGVGWSHLYPSLSGPLIAFLLLTIAAHAFIGGRFSRKYNCGFRPLKLRVSHAPCLVTLFLYALWTAEFIYEGGIPLLKMLLNKPFDYKLFGIPTLHVFVVTFSSFYTVFLFHHYLSRRSPQILFLFIVNLLAAILIYNRGMLLFNLSACAIVFLVYRGRLSLRLVMWGAAAVMILALLFGTLGTLRVSHETGSGYTNNGFLQTAGATERFLHSGMPSEILWGYIYATSPLANLQINITLNDPLPLGYSSMMGWVSNEVLFDFISKRLNYYRGETRAIQKKIHGPFNAATIYSGSYSYLGWAGVLLMAILILILPVIFIHILPSGSPFFLTGYALLSTVFLFMIFENTLRFTGLSFQLIYPVFFSLAIARFPWVRKIFSLS